MISAVALMWRDGKVKDSDMYAERGEILAGRKSGRENDDGIIYFNAVGAGILDIALTAGCYQKAKEIGIGQLLDFWV